MPATTVLREPVRCPAIPMIAPDAISAATGAADRSEAPTIKAATHEFLSSSEHG